MADSRGYFKVTNGFPEHSKIIEVGGDAAWLHVCAMAHCSRNLTDGMVPISLVSRLSDREHPKQLASRLLDVGLWHASGHACKKCVQPDGKHYVIHDYLDHQTSAERARETSAKRAIAGRRGGKAKAAASNLPSKLLGPGYDFASSKSLAEVEQEEEVHKKSFSSPPAAPDADPNHHRSPNGKRPQPHREDVERLCTRLAELMVANECKPPTITDTWRAETRRMIDIDGREPDKALALLEWSQRNPFWKANIHSMPTFRAKYDQLRQQAAAEWERMRPPEPATAPPPPHCGRCDPATRLLDDDTGHPYRCPDCHPLTQKASTT